MNGDTVRADRSRAEDGTIVTVGAGPDRAALTTVDAAHYEAPWSGRPRRDRRQVVEGNIYRYRCGIAWRDLPEQFGPWQAVRRRHRSWSADGTWDQALDAILVRADAGKLDWSVAVDPTICCAQQHGANLEGHTGDPWNHKNRAPRTSCSRPR